MTAVTHDITPQRGGSRTASGLGFALASAACFALSGPVASGLLDAGWSAGSVVLIRMFLGALVVAPFAVVALHGRWGLLRRNAGVVLAYGVLAVAGAQYCFFAAVSRMQVGPALMIEYIAPAVVVVLLWVRHGQRPGPVTLIGAAVAALGLVLVLDLASGGGLDPIGVLWALGATAGLTAYFMISADESNGLPPMALAGGGLVIGSVLLGSLGLAGLMPLDRGDASTSYAGQLLPAWLSLAVLGVVTAAVAYATGIAASRRLGSRLASFVALLEVVSAVGFAWLLLAELPSTLQLVGGALILAGVVTVKSGE
jgi:drug/metabolite transporter (DMT)-like permease